MNQMELEPLEGVLAVLREGEMTGSNKLGLLLALIDLAPTLSQDGRLEIDVVCYKLLETHWQHVEPFAQQSSPSGGPVLLRQHRETIRAPTVLQEVARLRDLLEANGTPASSFNRAMTALDKSELRLSLLRVRRDTMRNPIRRLQTLAGQHIPFLYEVDGKAGCLVFNERAARALVVYGPMLRQLVEFRFAQHVVQATPELKSSAIEQAIAAHLFDHERAMPNHALRQQLVELQEGRCFYTGTLLRSWSLDHVLPWVLLRESSLTNFVMTSPSINSKKQGLLLSPDPLRVWADHVLSRLPELEQLSSAYGWEWEPESNVRSLRAFYARYPDGIPLWSVENNVSALDSNSRSVAVDTLDDLLERIAS